MQRTIPLALCAVVAATAALAQHSGHPQTGHKPAMAAPAAQPYAGQDARQITSLSADEIAGYRAGAGMGFAKPAELLGFPGPMHVLELDKELALTDTQRSKTKAAMDSVKAKTRALGERYIAAEQAVDDAFRTGAPRGEIAKRVAAAERLRTEIRQAHLDAHLEITPLLSKAQLAKYAELRGYGAAGHGGHKH